LPCFLLCPKGLGQGLGQRKHKHSVRKAEGPIRKFPVHAWAVDMCACRCVVNAYGRRWSVFLSTSPDKIRSYQGFGLAHPRGARSHRCVYMCAHMHVCEPVCIMGSSRWVALFSAPTCPLYRPKTRGITTFSMSCWLGCLPSSGKPSAYRRLRPTIT
jgi:hypothetical protein